MTSRQSKPWAMKRFETAWKPPLKTCGQWRTNSCRLLSFLLTKSREYSSLTDRCEYLNIHTCILIYSVSAYLSPTVSRSIKYVAVFGFEYSNAGLVYERPVLSCSIRLSVDVSLLLILWLFFICSYGMRFIAKVLKDTLNEKFPDATEDEILKVCAP